MNLLQEWEKLGTTGHMFGFLVVSQSRTTRRLLRCLTKRFVAAATSTYSPRPIFHCYLFIYFFFVNFYFHHHLYCSCSGKKLVPVSSLRANSVEERDRFGALLLLLIIILLLITLYY